VPRKPRGGGNARPFAARGKPAWMHGCKMTSADEPDGRSVHNVLRALGHAPEWRDVLAFDSFAHRVVIQREIPRPPGSSDAPSPRLPRPLDDNDVTAGLDWFHAHGMVQLKAGTLYSAMLLHAREHSFHPVLDFFDAVMAGEAPKEQPSKINDHRIDPELPALDPLSLLLTLGFGAQDTPLNRAIARASVISMVRRVRQPGCQQDHMPVLIGGQGLRKSSGLRALVGPDWFSDHLPNLRSKDARIQLQGRVLIEWSEMGALRGQSFETIKAFITARVDRFRPPYGRAAIDIERTVTFAGTSNAGDFLDDATGGRRFWPVDCASVDCEWISANRRLVWRLACEAEAAGEAHWITDSDLQDEVRERQADAQKPDPWQERVMRSAIDGMAIDSGFLSTVLQIPVEKQDNGHVQRVANILRRNGWVRRRERRGGERGRRWYSGPEQAP
jgi:predicted P-loop ATPase